MKKKDLKLYIIYGINGCGKLDVALKMADRLEKKGKKVLITRESRILMYLLGIIDEFDAVSVITKEKYKILENTHPLIIKNIYKKEYKKFVDDQIHKHDAVIMLSHLVYALYIDKDTVEYLTDFEIPEWLINQSRCILNVQPESQAILSKRVDITNFTSDELNLSIKDIKIHKKYCDERWAWLMKQYPNSQFMTLKNNSSEGLIKKILQDVDN